MLHAAASNFGGRAAGVAAEAVAKWRIKRQEMPARRMPPWFFM
jgi:hypothetical protein